MDIFNRDQIIERFTQLSNDFDIFSFNYTFDFLKIKSNRFAYRVEDSGLLIIIDLDENRSTTFGLLPKTSFSKLFKIRYG